MTIKFATRLARPAVAALVFLTLSASAALACKEDYCAGSLAPSSLSQVGGPQDYTTTTGGPGFPGPDPGCAIHDGSAITAAVTQAKANLTAAGADLSGACGAESILSAATALLGGGAGCFSKTYGNNCNGVSTDLMCFSDGYCYDVLGDGGGANNPQCNSDFVGAAPPTGNGTDPSRYQAGCP